MPSWQSRIVQGYIRLTIREGISKGGDQTLRFARKKLGDARLALFATPRTTVVEQIDEDGIKGEWVTNNFGQASIDDAVLLYLHGGGYVACSPATHRAFTANVSSAGGIRVFSLDYRLAPEHLFPAAVDDAVRAYDWLLDKGFRPERIIVGGDSAGGGLTLALIHALRQQGKAQPGMAFCLSPWTDLTASGESVIMNEGKDPMFKKLAGTSFASMYLGDAEPTNPLASPLFGDFRDFPPLLVFVSDTELLFDDSTRLATRVKEAGSRIDLRIEPGQPHVWPVMVGFLPEARDTINVIGSSIRQILVE